MDPFQLFIYIEVLIGVLVAALIYLDMRNAGRVEVAWVLIGLLLGLIGGLLYYVAVRQRRGEEFSYPPAPRYGKPDYPRKERRAEEPPARTEKGPEREEIEGIPRCPHCGAAISPRDWDCPKCGAELKEGP